MSYLLKKEKMKKRTTFWFLLIATIVIKAQSGWTKITSVTNPIFGPQVSGQYNGAAWVDVDNDGDVDLFASPNKLFRNDGSGNFVSIDSLNFKPGINAFGGIVGGSSWADLNNDGYIDCVIAQHPSGVFINNGNNTFSNATSSVSGLSNYASWGCAIGSLDNDKYLDWVYAHAQGFHAGGSFPSKLFVSKNNSVMPSPKVGITLTDSLKPYTVPYWSDFDLDGDMDLFVASGPGGSAGFDYCYKNLKIETGLDSLVRITSLLFTSQSQDGQCYNFVDYDNDGDLDLCLTNYTGAPSRLYNNNLGVYTTVSAPWATSALPYLTNCWGDYDNDGDLDMITTSDNFSARYYRNNGSGSFTFISSGINTPAGTSGATNGDYDNDGDLDVYLHGRNNAKALFRNDTVAANRNWVNIKCIGTNSNFSAIGAILRVKAIINGTPVWQMREINAQNSFQSQNDLRVHFGLKDATIIDSIKINWPSGLIQSFVNIAVNQFYSVTEGGTIGTVTALNRPDTKDSFVLFPNPSNGLLNIRSNYIHKIKLVEICSVQGSKMLEAEVKEAVVDVSKLKPGVYIVKCKINSEVLSSKFVIE